MFIAPSVAVRSALKVLHIHLNEKHGHSKENQVHVQQVDEQARYCICDPQDVHRTVSGGEKCAESTEHRDTSRSHLHVPVDLSEGACGTSLDRAERLREHHGRASWQLWLREA